MDEVSRVRMNKLVAAVFALLGAARLFSYWRSGESVEAMWGAGMLLVAFSVYRSRLIHHPGHKATSPMDRLATIGGYFGLALLLAAMAKLLLP